ncbi:MAG: hypothetical protein PUP46_11000 [Endozoicomonas sp. (ex Botrylloides leachii)]|nr:hypothetical protein [Endozoicomonas sp. (ex Botrylloides leachii)]
MLKRLKASEGAWLVHAGRILKYQEEARDIVYMTEGGFVVESFRDYGYSSRGGV